MDSTTLRIISMVRERVDAFLKEMFDIYQSYEDNQKSPWNTVAAEIAICELVEVLIRRQRNERTLFAHLPTDVVHSIFGMALDVDRVHDPDLSLNRIEGNRLQLFRMRRVSSTWNRFLLSSPRYWQTINIKSPHHVITTGIERSGSAPLCVYCQTTYTPGPLPTHLPEELQSCARVQTLRSGDHAAYRLCRSWLRDHRPALQTLQLTAPFDSAEETTEPLGNLPSIRHLTAWRWQPPSDMAWLTGLRELDLTRDAPPDMELLRLLSTCANLERLAIFTKDAVDTGELLGVISPVTLPWLQNMRLVFVSSESAMKLLRRLLAPQCLRRTLSIEDPLDLGQYFADYRRFMSLEENCTDDHSSARINIERRIGSGVHWEYETGGRKVDFDKLDVEEAPIIHDLVQEFQNLFKEPSLTVTIKCSSGKVWPFLESLGNQNIQTVVFRSEYGGLKPDHCLKVIGVRSDSIPDGAMTSTFTDWPFKSLRSIEIRDAKVDLDDFPRLVEEYLDKRSKPLLEEIVLDNRCFEGMKLTQAAEMLEAIGINLRVV